MRSIALIISLLTPLTFSTLAHTEEPYRINIGKNYEKYSDRELRERVWQLERAVAQLQNQVFQLAMKSNGSGGGQGYGSPSGQWTCHIESFGKTHVAGANTRAAALALVLKKCGDATDAIHCHESDVKCDNE